MTYNFDEIIDRHGTSCLKHDFHAERGIPEDALSLWVADMDFRGPQEVIDAVKKAADHGIFGYSNIKETYFETVHNWFTKNFNWQTKRDWLVTTPGVVYAINLAIRAFTKEGDGILIQRPVYYPFSKFIEENSRTLVNNPLVYENGTCSIDFQAMESQIITNNVKLFIFCSPHNPVGRVWTKEELTQIGSLCLKHNVIIVSDEIHADFTYAGHKHTMLASISKEISQITITCTAPSKTFNMAGLQISNIFIENPAIREAFCDEMTRSAYEEPNCLGIVACEAAYKYGRDWLDQLLVYLKGNIDYVHDYLAKYLPKIKTVETQGTYLVWLDFLEYHLSLEELEDLIKNKARLWLDPGTIFGPEGAGFQRINIASPRSVIEQAMHQLRNVFEGL